MMNNPLKPGDLYRNNGGAVGIVLRLDDSTDKNKPIHMAWLFHACTTNTHAPDRLCYTGSNTTGVTQFTVGEYWFTSVEYIGNISDMLWNVEVGVDKP